MNIAKLCQPIELVLSDVDGVLTDGGVIFNNDGVEIKRFHIRDGLGVRLWQKAGGRFGIVTGRSSHIVSVRATELGIDVVRQGVEDKAAAVRELLRQLNLEPRQLAYIGDDLPDIAAVRLAGLGVAVADAAEEVRRAADYVTSLGGGCGAVRETIETILKAQHRWDELVQGYGG